MPANRHDQRQDDRLAERGHDVDGFAGLWSSHQGELCPPEPAHQRALNLLPMDSEGAQACAGGFGSRDKKRQRSVVKKDMEEPPQAAPVECAGSKKRKKGKRTVQNRDDITIFPRRKAGQDKLGSNRPPIVISRSVLESYFNMPQQKVCEKLVSGEPEQRFGEALSCACACA